jgi:hypothetical protein
VSHTRQESPGFSRGEEVKNAPNSKRCGADGDDSQHGDVNNTMTRSIAISRACCAAIAVIMGSVNR